MASKQAQVLGPAATHAKYERGGRPHRASVGWTSNAGPTGALLHFYLEPSMARVWGSLRDQNPPREDPLGSWLIPCILP